MFQLLVVFITPALIIALIAKHIIDLNKQQSDVKQLHAYINRLADFEPTQINIGRSKDGLFNDALLFNENSGEIMIIEKNESDQFNHSDFDVKELFQSEIRINGLVVSSVHCDSITRNKFRDLRTMLEKEMNTRNDVKTMLIRIYLQRDEKTFIYDVPLLNRHKNANSEEYLEAKINALHWQFAFSKHCLHERNLKEHPEQLTIESLQTKLGLEESMEFV